MFEPISTAQPKIKAYLVGQKNEEFAFQELYSLIDTLNIEKVGETLVQLNTFNPKYAIGSGKAEEINASATNAEADCVIFNFEISPTQQRNLETLFSLPVFDRNEVILRIFAQRAITKEAVLQVELARLIYSLPRIAHSYGSLSRQRGGSYGSKGSGETKRELDKREVELNIFKIKKSLEKVKNERDSMRKKRTKLSIPLCSLVGYTNAGKSSLLNMLTGSTVFVEDKLFATLDPSTRKFYLQDGKSALLSDTVGFIGNIPHTLIDAFKSTLEEASLADILLIVLDCADENVFEKYETVEKVLSEIEASQSNRIIVLNKVDKLELLENSQLIKSNLQAKFPDGIFVSAKSKLGLQELRNQIYTHLYGSLENNNND